MSERKKAIQRLRTRAREKTRYAYHSYQFYDELRRTLRPLYWPRWMSYEVYLTYFKGQYDIVDRRLYDMTVLVAPRHMEWFTGRICRLRELYFRGMYYLIRLGIVHKIIDPELGERPSWGWLWRGYKKARANRAGK